MKRIFLYSLMFISMMSATTTNAQLHTVTYMDGAQKLNSLVIEPKGTAQHKAGMLILPAWMGIDDHAKDVATKLSKLGYYALVADIYGEGHYAKDAKTAGTEATFYKTNVTAYQQRIRLALAQLVKAGADADRIVVIGYCFGGTGALEAARMNMPVKGVVSFHGGLGKSADRPNGPIKAHVLVCHGADDPHESPEEIKAFQQEMRDGKADWQMIYYANAVHAFTDPTAGNDNSKGAAYNALADKRSWEHFMIFLKEVL